MPHVTACLKGRMKFPLFFNSEAGHRMRIAVKGLNGGYGSFWWRLRVIVGDTVA